MNDSDRPDLGLRVYVEIETKQNEVNAKYWHQLRDLQIFIGADTPGVGLLHPQLPPAKQPMRLLSVLADYAVELFAVEAKEYPREPLLKKRLENLAERTRRSVPRIASRSQQTAITSTAQSKAFSAAKRTSRNL